MNEKSEETQVTTPDPLNYSPTDAARDLNLDETPAETPKPETPTEAVTPEQADEPAETPKEEVVTEEDSSDTDLLSKLSLDASIADKLPEDVKTRWEQQVNGIAKISGQLKDRESALKVDEQGYTVYKSYAEAFASENPQVAREAFEDLGRKLADFHKWDTTTQTQEVTTAEPIANGDGSFEYDGQTFYSIGEVNLYKKIQALEAQRAKPDPESEEVKSYVRQTKAEKEAESWLNANVSRIAATVAHKADGWGVDKDKIAEARRQFPDLMVTDPTRALKMVFPDDYAKHVASKAGAKPELPTLTESATAKAYVRPEDPLAYSVHDAAKELGLG